MIKLLLDIKHRCPWIWDAIERLNGRLFRLRSRKPESVVSALPAKVPEGFRFLPVEAADIPELSRFLSAQPEERLQYFRPHNFDEKSLRKRFDNPSFLMMKVRHEDDGRLAGYFFLRHRLGDILQNIMQPSETEVVTDTTAQAVVETEEAVEVTEPAPENMIPEGKISQEQILAEFLEASGELSPAENKYPDLITTEPMHEASRLTWMAKRYYGAKIYWPYLYDANRDVISNPHNIEVGTPIRVPKLTKLQLDTTNAQTMATIESLREEALRSGE